MGAATVGTLRPRDRLVENLVSGVHLMIVGEHAACDRAEVEGAHRARLAALDGRQELPEVIRDISFRQPERKERP